MCDLCYQELPEFYGLRQQKISQQSFPFETANADPDDIINRMDDMSLKQELRSCQHFLVDFEPRRAGHSLLHYAEENLDATLVDKRLDYFFRNLKCAAKVILAFEFILKKLEDGGFRYFYAHKINILLDWSKYVCTKEDRAKLKDNITKSDVIESCSKARKIIKWRFYKLTTLTLLKSQTFNCLMYGENTRELYKNNLCLFVLWFSICAEIDDRKRKLLEISIPSLREWTDSVPVSPKESTCPIFQLLRFC